MNALKIIAIAALLLSVNGAEAKKKAPAERELEAYLMVYHLTKQEALRLCERWGLMYEDL